MIENSHNNSALAPCFMLRRDFADELGFGWFLQAQPRAAALDPLRAEQNRILGLSPALPRFLAYFTHSGSGRITADFKLLYKTPIDGLFGDVLERFSDWKLQRCLTAWADSYDAGVPEVDGEMPSVEADENGCPKFVIAHDTHTGAVYLWTVTENTLDFFKTQP